MAVRVARHDDVAVGVVRQAAGLDEVAPARVAPSFGPPHGPARKRLPRQAFEVWPVVVGALVCDLRAALHAVHLLLVCGSQDPPASRRGAGGDEALDLVHLVAAAGRVAGLALNLCAAPLARRAGTTAHGGDAELVLLGLVAVAVVDVRLLQRDPLGGRRALLDDRGLALGAQPADRIAHAHRRDLRERAVVIHVALGREHAPRALDLLVGHEPVPIAVAHTEVEVVHAAAVLHRVVALGEHLHLAEAAELALLSVVVAVAVVHALDLSHLAQRVVGDQLLQHEHGVRQTVVPCARPPVATHVRDGGAVGHLDDLADAVVDAVEEVRVLGEELHVGHHA